MILINPQFDRLKKLRGFSRYVPMSLPLGIGMLAGYLEHNDKTVKILDEQIYPITPEVLESFVKGLMPPLIFGISCYTASIGRGYEVAQLIKSKYPESFVVMGGIHPTVLPEEALKTGFVDIVIRGEGEITLDLLYDAIKKRQDYTIINGISFKNSEGLIIHNENPETLVDLNALPSFPYHLFEKHINRYNLGFILSARGCPYACIFCSQRLISGRFYRYREPEKVIKELDLLINKYQQKFISFFDDNFVVDKNRTKKLCELIYQNGFHEKAAFDCQTRGDAIDPGILGYLKAANFTNIFFGLETASERLIKLINKNETVAQNIAAVKLVKKFNFSVSGAFILGLPTETKKERLSSYKMAIDLGIDFARFNNATPYPGTILYEMAKQENRLNVGKNWENLNACGTLVEGVFSRTPLAYVPLTTTEAELKRDVLLSNMLFWFRPKRIFRLLVEGRVAGGWLNLPKNWYFKPSEIYSISKIGLLVIISWVKIIFSRARDKA